MFGTYVFRVKADLILNNRFKYDPAKFAREQRAGWAQIVGDCYHASGKPVDAAVLFMIVQMNLLSKEARGSEFVERTFGIIGELKYQMTPKGRDWLRGWIADFDAETAKQNSETDHETFMRHLHAD